ncbi:MAG TPA: hypothetical protein VMS71_06350, partial [Candidatus Acidoferrum sp.]|nr:hypothetical protein [Candidatus Acidoferrum sp.]
KIAIGEPSYLENQMATGDTHLYDLTVPGNTTKLKVTLVWDDPGGTGLAGKNLINDLDLSLVPPSGPEQLPWVLDPTIPSLDATKGVNRTDNVETVEINNPQAGLWKAKVNGYNIPNGPQKYSLVFTPDSIYTPGNVKALAVYPGGDKTTNPGTSAPVRFWATNIGLNPDSVRVQISDTKSWLNRAIDTVVYLTSYDSAYFDLTAQVPSGLSAGENDTSTCTATSRSDGSVTAHSTVTVTVAAVFVVDLVPPANDTVGSPASKPINVTVWNHGNATNTITITPSDQRGWPFRPPNRQFVLTAGTSTVASFTADVPAEEPNQATNLITLTATSTGGAGNVTSYTLTVNNPYFPPSLLSPDTLVYLNTRTPHFVWSHGSGSSYGLYIATDSILTQTVRVYHGLTDTAYTIPSADSLPDRGYYWGVRLFSGSDSSSFQRHPRRLIVDNLAPNPVTPSSPVAKYDSTKYVTYVLGGSPKPLVDSVSPEFNVIQVSADSTFAVGVTTYQPISAMTFQAPDTLGQGRFYWRSRRADVAGNSSGYSAKASFVHDTKAPAIPTVLAPATGRNLKGSSILFKWTEGTPPPYAQSPTYYFLHISNLANFGDYNTFANFVYADSQVVNTSLLTPGTHYYWRLKAIDSVGFYSDYGPTYEFTYTNFVCGDVDHNGVGPDISDLSYLVDFLFVSGPPPAVLEASSFDCNLVLDISDLTVLVDFLFANGAPLCCPQ